MNKNLLATLYENQVYLNLLEELKKARPIVPLYDWDKNNIDEIKAKSCIRQGFDLAMSYLTINGD